MRNILLLLFFLSTITYKSQQKMSSSKASQIQLVTLDPRHFHAAPVQKYNVCWCRFDKDNSEVITSEGKNLMAVRKDGPATRCCGQRSCRIGDDIVPNNL